MSLVRFCLAASLLLAPAAAQAAPAKLDFTTADVAKAADSGIRMISPALRCSDPERSVKFYTQGLGMIEMGRVNLKDVTEIILGFARDPGVPGIMLIKRKDDGATPGLELGTAYQRTVLRVPNLQAVIDRLKAAGYETGPTMASGPYKILMIKDPDGYRYELVEFPKGANGG